MEARENLVVFREVEGEVRGGGAVALGHIEREGRPTENRMSMDGHTRKQRERRVEGERERERRVELGRERNGWM